MLKICAAFFLIGMTLPAAAATPDFSNPLRIDVTLSSFEFAPDTLRLHAAQPILLHIQNDSSSGHDFTAPAFFASAAIRPGDAALIRKGSIEVKGHSSIDLVLIPAAGQFPLKCSHPFHKTMGMKGSIVVD